MAMPVTSIEDKDKYKDKEKMGQRGVFEHKSKSAVRDYKRGSKGELHDILNALKSERSSYLPTKKTRELIDGLDVLIEGLELLEKNASNINKQHEQREYERFLRDFKEFKQKRLFEIFSFNNGFIYRSFCEQKILIEYLKLNEDLLKTVIERSK